MNTQKKFSDEAIIEAVKTSISFCEVCKKIGCKYTGGSYTNIVSRIKNLGIDFSHFYTRENRRKKFNRRINYIGLPKPKNRRINGSTLRSFLFKNNIEYKCSICHIQSWMESKIILEVDHIDNNHLNNDISNLRFLCPNCHSQKTYLAVQSKKPDYKSLLEYIDKNGLKQSSEFYNVSKETIRKWLLNYEFNSLIEPSNRKQILSREIKTRPTKFPGKEILSELVKDKPLNEIGKMYGVQGNAVKKWCKKFDIPFQTRGYWQKRKAGKI